MTGARRIDWAHDLVLPTTLFVALGGMTWAVRGCSGFGATPGCIFAGVMWGAAWWYISRDSTREQSRRYTSAWIVLAVTLGVGLSGARGWMQWPSFFEGRLQTDYGKGEFVPISRTYGFIWLFIAGMPWAGIGACALAWCGSLRETRVWHWMLRILCGVGGSLLAGYLYDTFPQYFLPLYSSIEERYKDLEANPNLRRLMNDSGAAIRHMGYYLGFLLFEVIRRDWKNVVLITTVGVVNGAGWALCQNWKWAPGIWKDANFNWWRCWESSGGLSIGLAYGLAYFLVNRRMSDEERATVANRQVVSGPNFEWLLVFCGLTWFVSLYLSGGMGRGGAAGPTMDWLTSLIQKPGLKQPTTPISVEGVYMKAYFTIVLLFAPLYYFLNRSTPQGEVPRSIGPVGFLKNIEWVGLGVAAALIAGLFYVGVWTRDLLDLIKSESMSRREMFSYAIGMARAYGALVVALGMGWYLIRRRTLEAEKVMTTPVDGDPNLERLGLYVGLLTGLGLSVRNGLKGWFNIYYNNIKPPDGADATLADAGWFDGRFNTYLKPEDYWSTLLWQILGPVFLVILLAIVIRILWRPLPRNFEWNFFPHAFGLMWLVLLVQNGIGQLVTGPLTNWNEMAFSIYYLLLFAITAVIVIHYHRRTAGERGVSAP